MPTPEETLAAFQGGFAPPPNLPDPFNAALETLRNVGAIPSEQVPAASVAPPPIGQPVTPDQGPMPPEYAPPAYAPPPALNPYQAPAPVGLGELEPDPVFTGLPQAATVAQAEQNVGNAVQGVGTAQEDAIAADQAAKQERARREAEVLDKGVAETDRINSEYAVAKTRDRAASDAEMATYLHELSVQATKEPNPGRWWDNQSGLGQVLWAMGMLAGAAYVAITPGAQNAALAMVSNEIDKDVARQQKRMEQEIAALKAKGQVMEARHLRNASDLRDENTMKLTRLQAAERAWMARAIAPNDMDAQAAQMAGKLKFEELKMPLIEKQLARLNAEKAAATDRKFQAQQQAARLASARRLQEDEQDYNAGLGTQGQAKLARDLAMKDVSMGVSYAPGGAVPLGKDGKPIYETIQSGLGAPAAGLVLKDTKTGQVAHGTGEIRVDPEDAKDAAQLGVDANRMYTSTKRLRDLIKSKKGAWQGVMGAAIGTSDPELAGLMTEMGYLNAKTFDPGGRITDKDQAAGKAAKFGFDADGNWLQRGKFFTNLDEIEKMLDKDLNAMPKRVSAAFRPFNRAHINGQGTEIVWDPKYLEGDAVQERSARAGKPVVTFEQKPVTGVADYTKRVQTEAADPSRKGTLVPEHDAAPVQHIIDEATGRGPRYIRDEADRTLQALKAKKKALDAVAQSARDPWAEQVSPEQATQAAEESNRVATTIQTVQAVAKDAEKKAKATLDRFEKNARDLATYEIYGKKFSNKFLTPDVLRNNAQKKFGLTDAEDEVSEVIDRVLKVK